MELVGFESLYAFVLRLVLPLRVVSSGSEPKLVARLYLASTSFIVTTVPGGCIVLWFKLLSSSFIL